MHSVAGRSHHEARAASNIWTNTVPTSRTTHSSNTACRKVPHAAGSTDRSVTVSPSWNPVSFSRSTMGMNWMNLIPRSSRKYR